METQMVPGQDQTEEGVSYQHHCTLIARMCHFSREDLHIPGEISWFTDYSVDGEYFEDTFFLCTFANGNSKQDNDYVSIYFSCIKEFHIIHFTYFELSCVVAVIDTFGNKRFLRSFTFPCDTTWSLEKKNMFPYFGIDQYIERKTLLFEPSDLLPGDCLTLHIEVTIHTLADPDNSRQIDAVVLPSFEREECGDGFTYNFFLDSMVAQCLYEISSYFQRMFDTPMKERSTRHMNIPADEYPFFKNLCNIVMGATAVMVQSIDDICHMYMLADKYDIQIAVETCRNLLKTFLRIPSERNIYQHAVHSVSPMLTLAEMYNDVHLKECIESFQSKIKEDVEGSDRTLEAQQENLETKWNCQLSGVIPNINFKLIKGDIKFKEEPKFDFYQ